MFSAIILSEILQWSLKIDNINVIPLSSTYESKHRKLSYIEEHPLTSIYSFGIVGTPR